MSDSKAKDEGDRQDRQQIEKAAPNSLEGTSEGQQVRNAKGDLVEAIKAANPNASDGSVKNWAQMTGAERYAHAEQNGQEESFVLVDQKPLGIEVVAARQMVPGVKLESQEQPIGQNLIAQNLIAQNLAEVDNRPIKNYDYQVKQHGEHKVIETGLQYQAGKPPEVTERSLFERIGALPLEQQAFVVGAGIKAFNGEFSHQQFRIGIGVITGLGDGVVGLAEGAESLGTAIIGVAQFSRDVMANDPAAVDTAGKAGESLGKLMVGGIRVFSAADAYLGSVGAATNDGDYTKALRDVSWLGQQINSRWEAMTPEAKTRLITKLTVENLGDLALIVFRTAKIAKSEKIIETLEAMGTEAGELGAGQRDKAGKFISRLLDELMPQPMGVTPDGRLMPVPRDHLRNEANALMSKADDLDDGRPRRSTESENREQVPEKFPPSKRFATELKQAVESFSEAEKNFLHKHGIVIKPIRRIADRFPEKRSLGACYDATENTIYVGEEVSKLGKFVQNYDLQFAFRHEFGHAFNAKCHQFGEYLSETPKFRAAFKQDIKNISAEKLEELKLKFPTIEQMRDEVFADIYAHAMDLQSSNPRSMQMKELFPNCLKDVKERLLH